ncbi:sugar ABC transporter permease [Chromatiales bacterium (ex Bugula neritina AB1)]|nr:sugar ABC transporter permease [Chromatiales bacterium (ex Bugula neritina AB1)]
MTSLPFKSSLRYFTAVFVVAVFIFPIFWFALTAIKPRSAVFNKDTVVWFDFAPTIDNFLAIWNGPSVYSISDSMASSVIVATGSTVLALAISLPAAYCLSRMNFRGQRLILISALIHRFLPPIAIIIPLFFIFHNLGLRDTHAGVIVAHALINIPIAVLLLKSFIDDIPKRIDDMSTLDGATRFQTFWHIILPGVRGGIAATTALCFIFSWTEYLLSLFLTSSIRTLPVRISLFDPGSQVSVIAATGTSAIIPAFIFILLVQKHLVRGLTMGALKE